MRRSTGRLYAFCTVVFGLGLAASGYLNYVQYQRLQEHQQVDRDTVAQLQSQISAASSSPTPTPAPAVLGAKVIKISELGITLATINPLSDLSYQFQEQNGLDGVNLSSASLIKTTTTCGPGALGRIVRQPANDPTTMSSNNLIKQMGTYNFYYVPTKTPCAKDPVTTAALKADNAIMPAILATLTVSS